MNTYEEQECINCFVRFGVPNGFTAARRKDSKSFFCPNGHPMAYSKDESEESKLRRERDRLTQKLAEKDADIKFHCDRRTEAEAAAQKAKKETARLKKRSASGVCPCCNRSFIELQRHMSTKHPEFRADDEKHENIVSILKGKKA